MKLDQQNAIREYVQSLSDSDLGSIATKLVMRLSGDLPEAINMMGRNRVVDEVLRSTNGANELYEYCDVIRDMMLRESNRRGMTITR